MVDAGRQILKGRDGTAVVERGRLTPSYETANNETLVSFEPWPWNWI
jgi:hypothetical protein